jgi:hypothetical protein
MSWQILIDYGDGWVDITGYGGDDLVRDSLKLTEKLHDDDFKPALGSATFSCTLTPALSTRLLQCTGTIPCEIYHDGVIWFRGFSRPVTKYKVTDNDRTIDFEIYDYGYLLESTLQDDVMITDGKICDPEDPDHSIVHLLLSSAGYPQQYIGISETIDEVIPKLTFASGDSYADDLAAILWDYHHLYNVSPNGVIDIYDWASSSVEADGAFSEQNIIGSLEVERKDSEAEQVQVSFNQYEKLTGLTLYYEKVDKWESIASNSGQDAEGPALWPADGPYRCDYNLDIGSSNYEIVGAENQKLELHGYTWVSFGPEPGHSTWIDILGMGQLFGVYDLVMENHATTYSEFQFNLADGQLINEIKVTGDLDIVYKDQKKTSVFSRPESTGKLKKYSANYLYDDDAATELANALYSSITTGRLHYTFKSLTEKSLGSYVTVSSLSLGISNTVRITSRSWDVETEIWEYEGVSVAPLETILGTVVAGQIVVPTNPDEAKSVAERVDMGLESDGSIIQPVNGNQLVDIDTTVAGLYMTATALGFFDGELWTAVINNDGTWSFLGDGDNYIKWDGSRLEVHGDLFLSGDSELQGKITAGNGIESDDYKQGVSGWKIGGDGDAFFNNVWLRGDLYGILHDLTIDGSLTLSGGAIKAGDTILDASGIRANAGRVGNWLLSATAIRSDEVGKARIELDPGDNRIEVWGAAGAEPRVAMGYLGGLSDPSDRTKSLASTIFGFWTADGDSIEIRGEMRLVNGQYVLQDDAALEIQDSSTGKAILRVGSNAGRQGVHFFDETEALLLSLVADGIKAEEGRVIFGKARSAFTSYPAGMPDALGISIESDRLVNFVATGNNHVVGFMDLSASFFTWDGNLKANGAFSAHDVYLNNYAIIANDNDGAFSDRSGSNIDHIWHDGSTNRWHFVSDASYKHGGNAQLVAGALSLGTSDAQDYKLLVAGGAKMDALLVTGPLYGSERLGLGYNRSSDGSAYIDLIGDTTYNEYGLRIIRNSGADSAAGIYHRGTGPFIVQTNEAGDIHIRTDSSKYGIFVKGSTGHVVIGGSQLSTATLYVNGTIRATGGVISDSQTLRYQPVGTSQCRIVAFQFTYTDTQNDIYDAIDSYISADEHKSILASARHANTIPYLITAIYKDKTSSYIRFYDYKHDTILTCSDGNLTAINFYLELIIWD